MREEKILLIDDEQELRELVKDALSLSGYKNILTAADTKEARKIIKHENLHLILLDVMMPGESGIELLKELRKNSSIPVILLTAKGESEDKYLGFESGADDYIVKPFLIKELILRIEAVLRRSYPNLSSTINLIGSKVDLNKAIVIKEDGNTFSLTAKEYSIFKKLYENAGNIVSINALCQDIVGDYFTGYENTLMSHIRHLRQKIERDPSNPESLITIRGLGYKLRVKNND